MISFTVKLAEVPFAIKTEYPDIKNFFADYMSEEEPEFILSANSDDRNRAEESLHKADETEGRGHHDYAPEDIEKTALHELVADAMPDYDAFLFHSSAIEYKNNGIMFAAASGTGKSTHAGFWMQKFNDVHYINDDKPFIVIKDGSPYIYGSPWMGKHNLGANAAVPLKCICLLERSEATSAESMDAAQGFVSFLQYAYRPKSKAKLEKTLNLLMSAVKSADCYRLKCAYDPGAAVIAKEEIFGEI